MSQILVTDSLFIGDSHIAKLEEAGHTVTRLDKPNAEPNELKEALQGKEGYILGGVERVTDEIVAAATELKAIAFTGSAFSEFIPCWENATRRGIAITAARGANANSVAEWALISGLSLIRNIPALTAAGGPDFYVAHEAAALTLGIVGYGNIGRAVRSKALALGLRVIVTDSQYARDDLADVVALDTMVSEADLVSLHVSQRRGHAVIDASSVARLRDGAVLVNASFEQAIDNAALARRLAAGELKAALDYPLPAAGDLPVGVLLASNAQTAFNTREANERVSDRTTQALINLIESGFDRDLVNPAFQSYR